MLRRKLLLDVLGRCARDAALWQCPIRKTAPIVVVLLMYGNLPRVADAETIRAYVTNWGDGTVSVIDAETFSVTATVPVGKRPIDIVAHPDGSRVYVSNRNSNTLSVIDTMTNEVIATVPMAGRPLSMDINSDGSRVYLANWEPGLVQVVDTATNSVISDIRASAPGHVAVHPDDSLVYATTGTRISVIDASTNERIDSVRTSLDGATWSLEVHPDGGRLYVNNAPIFPGFVGVIDTATMTQKSKIRVGQGATGIAIHPDGDSVYVSNRADDTISVIDTETDSVTDTISVSRGNFPTGLAVHPNGNLLYVTNWFGNSVSAIDLQTNEVLGTIPVGREPGQVTFAVLEPLSSFLLQAGDADQDLDFDQLDLVQVQIGGKYLTGGAATWGQGDWNGAPGGTVGSPPAGDGLFDQRDIIAAQQAGVYLSGPYAAIQSGGKPSDGQTSVIYNADTGEVAVDAPAGVEMTSINIDSASGIFTGEAAQNLGGSFDNDADGNIFKATFGSSFGSLSFGHVAEAGLSEDFVANDLTVVGSLAGGGDLGAVDLIYVPEPSTRLLLGLGWAGALMMRRRKSSSSR